MMNLLIEKYVKKMTIDDIKSFLLKNNIHANSNDINFFYHLIKTNYKDIIKNPNDYLKLVKDKLSDEDYKKISNLYLTYSNYL